MFSPIFGSPSAGGVIALEAKFLGVLDMPEASPDIAAISIKFKDTDGSATMTMTGPVEVAGKFEQLAHAINSIFGGAQ